MFILSFFIGQISNENYTNCTPELNYVLENIMRDINALFICSAGNNGEDADQSLFIQRLLHGSPIIDRRNVICGRN